jgi:uncharacterized protein (TIGR02302 family)
VNPTSEARPPDEPPRPAGESALLLLKAALGRARSALFVERLWPLVAALVVGFGLFLAVSWAGLWLALPPVGRVVGIVLFAAILIVSLIPAIWLRIPHAGEALQRLNQATGLAHRPATAITDRLATGAGDPMADALWRAHRARATEFASRLRAGKPRPHLAVRDPFAVRALVLLAVVSTYFVAGDERWSRVAAAFDWRGVTAPVLYRVDAWVTPPVYTGRAPVLLPGIRHDAPAPGEIAAIPVPASSELVVRATGVAALELEAHGGVEEDAGDLKSEAADGSVERRFRVKSDGSLAVRGLSAGSAVWNFQAVPDRPPVIAHTRDPEVMGRASLSLGYRVEDDYGVVSAEARFQNPQTTVPEGAPAPRSLVEPPNFALTLPQSRTRAGAGQTIRDMTEHPWAGTTATLVLAARDEGGNEGTSEPREIRLPGRPFNKPIARALVELRRHLALDINARGRVGRALDALLIAPEQFAPEAAVYLGLRTAATRLKIARSDDDLRSFLDYLWEIAILIEDGTLSDVERELRAAQEALRQALEQGASDEEIRRLTEALREAVDRFMQALAEQLRRDANVDDRPLDRNAQMMRPQDLRSMLDRIEKLARSGARDAARRLLDEMQAMLENLSRDRMARGDMGGELGSMLDELSRMIQEQQRLRDRTFRQGRDSRNEQRSRGPEQGMSERDRRNFGDLQRGQEGLRQQLQQMLEQLRRQQEAMMDDQAGMGDQAGEALGRAEGAMGDAEGALGEGDADNAVDGQGRALQNLRRGAQSLVDSLQGGEGDMYGDAGNFQVDGAERTDPLGRPVRSREYGDDFSVKIPDEIDAQRARRVLEELRRRLGEQERPRLELDYIERLLRDF